jgi:predicted TIM-barrel fold metal-dependent hydrolase
MVNASMDELAAESASLPLVDHHVHSCLVEAPSLAQFELSISESEVALGPGQSRMDSQAGFALAALCGTQLTGVPVPPQDYLRLRAGWAEPELQRVLLRGAGVSDWLIDTGHGADRLVGLTEFGRRSGGRVHEVARLEAMAEVLLASGVSPHDFPDALRQDVQSRAAAVVGFKSIAAYRSGFAIDWALPSDAEVSAAVAALDSAGRARLIDPVVIRFAVHTALRTLLPLQLHVGIGDRDVDMLATNPLHLRRLLAEAEALCAPVVLLHCSPYEREAGYLCQNHARVYMDVGLSTNLMGASGVSALERAMELCPFPRLLYSSDAWGLAELHFLGAALWRRQFTALVTRWVHEGLWSIPDAVRVARMVASGNATRLYRLTAEGS